MLYRIVKLEVSRKDIPKVKQLLEEIAPHVRAFKGCTYLEILFDLKKRGKIMTYSRWMSEAYLDAYRNSEIFRDFWSKIKPHFIKPAEATSFTRDIHLS